MTAGKRQRSVDEWRAVFRDLVARGVPTRVDDLAKGDLFLHDGAALNHPDRRFIPRVEKLLQIHRVNRQSVSARVVSRGRVGREAVKLGKGEHWHYDKISSREGEMTRYVPEYLRLPPETLDVVKASWDALDETQEG